MARSRDIPRQNYRLLLYGGVGVGFLCGFFLAWFLWGLPLRSSPVTGPLRLKGYQFIAPLLACQTSSNSSTFSEYQELKSTLNTTIAQEKQAHKAQDVSVYFQDLTTGRWTGINQDELYAPASLDKVALLVAFLKEAQTDPTVLDKRMTFTGSQEGPDDPEDFQPMMVGQSYSVQDLLYRLIVYSDNDAKDYLHGLIDQNSVNEVFTDLSLPAPAITDVGDTMSAKSYSLFFRTLYNSTYLNDYMSESALQLLSETKFKVGLVAGLPASTTVSHKFGHRHFDTPQSGITDELHDCGIVYAPSKPYFVCVMTKGWSVPDLESTIQDISGLVYQDVVNKP